MPQRGHELALAAGGRLAGRRPLEAVKNPDTCGEKTLTAAGVGTASSLRVLLRLISSLAG